MSDAQLFVLIFGGLLVLRILLATAFFALILPAGDRCVNCDRPTIRMESRLFDHALPWFRRSWCLHCGWHGILRRGEVSPAAVEREPVRR